MSTFGSHRAVSSSFALFLLAIAAPAFAQENGPPQDLGSPPPFVAKGAFHRVTLPSGSQEFNELLQRGAIVWGEDYGSFTLLYVDARRAGGIPLMVNRGAQIVDEMTLVPFDG